MRRSLPAVASSTSHMHQRTGRSRTARATAFVFARGQMEVIRESDKSHVTISFISDYGELDKRKYILDLGRDKKLVRIIPLPAEGIPDDLH
jgi:hypothetical protein